MKTILVYANILWDVVYEYYPEEFGHPQEPYYPATATVDTICLHGSKANLYDVLASSIITGIEDNIVKSYEGPGRID